jgi:phage gp29-like protein
MAQLLGPDGRPIPSRGLTEEAVTPSVTGVRHLFDEVVAPGLTPARLSRVLRDAADGEMIEFLTLAEEMEEREWQYRSVLGTRKTAIKAIEPFVAAASEDPEDVAIADAVKDELIARPEFRYLVGDLLDGLGKGYSVIELIWATDARRWSIAEFLWRDPRLFQFDRETRRTLKVRAVGAPDGLDLTPAKYAVHVPRLKSGLPARNGLARIAAWAFMLKSFTMKDWAAFLEVHGMPLRLGKYGPEASAEDRRVLLRAVRDLGSDAAAIIPRGMEIELVETKGFSDKPFEGLASYVDKAVSKVVIGQTMTADDGSSKAQAAIHDKVRIDIKEDDAFDLAVTINRDVIRPWVAFNYGPRPRNRYPTLVLPVMEREDLAAYARAIGELIDRGLLIEQAEVRDRIGHREPAAGAAVMVPKSSGSGGAGGAREGRDRPARPSDGDPQDDDADPADAAPAGARAALEPGRYRLDPARCPGCGTTARATLSAERVDAAPDLLEMLVEAEAERFERVMDPVRDALEEAFAAASDFEDLDRRLVALGASLPIDRLADRLAIAQLIARGLGQAGVDLDARAPAAADG